MPVMTEGPRKAEFMISEAEDYRSRDEVTVTVPANTTYEAGTLLGLITATGKFVRHDTGASDGSETVAGVLFQNLVNGTTGGLDYKATNIARAAQVRKTDLIYADGANASQITASDAALVALGIVVR